MKTLKQLFSITKHNINSVKPEIFLGAGLAFGFAGTISACKETLKADKIMKRYDNEMIALNKMKEGLSETEYITYKIDEKGNQNFYKVIDTKKEDIPEDTDFFISKECMDKGEYSEKDIQKDRRIMTRQKAIELTKTYLPSLVLSSIGTVLILSAHLEMKSRNFILSSGLTSALTAFNAYRANVKSKYGEEVDKEMRFGAKEETYSEVDENGKKKKVKMKTPDKMQQDAFKRIFDECNDNWNRNPEYNKQFLLNQQRYANNKLKAQGYLFLNEVLEALGFEQTKLGQMVGWVYDPSNPMIDSYVDFGIFNIETGEFKKTNQDIAKAAFVNGWEPSVWLDFNVDGDITYILK